MNDKLFRKSSLDKITGPEQLDDYIRVASPSLWVMLGAVVVLLIAVLVQVYSDKQKEKVKHSRKDGE